MSVYVPWRRVVEATNDECTCGGLGPEDPGICVACGIYHRLKAHARVRVHCISKPATEEDLAT